MNTIKEKVVFTQEINKSIFIGIATPVKDVSDVQKNLENIKKEYPNATHYCYAYALGKSGDDLRFSDDGEPQNTAGVVIYNVIKNKSLTNVLICVVRYFGGILLGAGGLVRAYSSTASGAIGEALVTPIIDYVKISFTVDYTYITPILKLMSAYEQLKSNYLEKVYFTYTIVKADKERLTKELIELTNGSIIFD